MKILLVEDDRMLAHEIAHALRQENFAVDIAANGEDGQHLGDTESYDAAVLDLGLPKIPGVDVLRAWRKNERLLPVLILTARDGWTDKVDGFKAGADDYLTKPFGMRELAARIRVALRHKLQQQGERPIFQVGDLSVDLVKRIVKVADKEVKLSPKEYEILRILVQHAGKVITHQHILKHVWGGATDVQYLRVYVRQLRQKIEATPDQPQYILTETGVGYRLREPEQ